MDNIISEFEKKYKNSLKMEKEIEEIEIQCDKIEEKKIDKIKSKTSFLLLTPILSYIIMIYLINPTGGETLLEMFIAEKDIELSIYHRMSEIMYIASFIYSSSILAQLFICNKVISKNIKIKFGLLVEKDMVKFILMFLCFFLSFLMSLDVVNHDNASKMFIFFIILSALEVLMYNTVGIRNKKIKLLSKEEFIKKRKIKKEMENKLIKENKTKEKLKNEILQKPLLMKQVINGFYSDTREKSKDYRYDLIQELMDREKETTEEAKVKKAYRNIYNKNIENDFEIENS